jgi:tetratricopeptide (TPR) repeat protein
VPLPDDVDARQLEPESRRELTSLSKETADLVARHLVMAGRLIDDDPAQALTHARAARALGGRVAVVREANGLVAYAAGEWAEALSELRTARRISGGPDHLPVMADCERALGRPDRALQVAEDPQVPRLSPAARVEMMIVVSGARRDMRQPEAAAVALEVPALEGPVRPWTARLRYAYADALLECGREDEARTWFARAGEVDELGETDADDRVLELDGMVIEDLAEGDDEASDEASEGPDVRDDAVASDEVDLAHVTADAPVEKSTSEASPQVSGGAGEDDSPAEESPAPPRRGGAGSAPGFSDQGEELRLFD